VRIDRPRDSESCASEKCGHPFGDHYLSHDQKTSGCAVALPATAFDASDVLVPCKCTGFLIAYLYKPRTRTAKVKP